MAIFGGILESFDGTGDTIIVIPATSAAAYEPYYLLSQISTVDGSGSGLDADLLDGFHASHFGTAQQVTNLQNTDVSLQNQISGLFAVGSRLVFKENFTGNGISTSAILTGALQNSAFSVGSWSAANVLTALQVDITNWDGAAIYDSTIPIYRDRIKVTSVDSFGNVTLNFPPLIGQQYSIWYFYQLQASNVLSYYYREDYVSEMESGAVQMAAEVDTNTSAWGNIVLRTIDNTVQKALDRLDVSVTAISSGGFTPLEGIGIDITPAGNNYRFDVIDYIGKMEVSAISGNLQSQINAIVEESTTIASSGGSILVTQNGYTFNLEVASAPVSNHNSLLGLQGSGTDYFHLNSTQFASISGGVDLSRYTLLTTTASISASLQSQIDLKQNEITLVAGSNIFIIESPEDTWTISTSGSGGSIVAGIQGKYQLDAINKTFTITHDTIDSTTEFPVCSLNVSTSASDLFIIGIHDRTDTSFKVTLSGVADASTYVLWHISTQSIFAAISIASSGGSILVGQNGSAFNLEVASAPVSNHNSMLGLQGSGADYFHLNATQFANISGGISLLPYTLLTTTASISGDLQSQIFLKQDDITLVAGSNITIFESPLNTWTISASGGGTVDLTPYTLLTTTESISGDLQAQINTKQSLPTVIAMAIALG